jgi:hypothetical protein
MGREGQIVGFIRLVGCPLTDKVGVVLVCVRRLGREWEMGCFGAFFGGNWTMVSFQESSNYAACSAAHSNPG